MLAKLIIKMCKIKIFLFFDHFIRKNRYAKLSVCVNCKQLRRKAGL